MVGSDTLMEMSQEKLIMPCKASMVMAFGLFVVHFGVVHMHTVPSSWYH